MLSHTWTAPFGTRHKERIAAQSRQSHLLGVELNVELVMATASARAVSPRREIVESTVSALRAGRSLIILGSASIGDAIADAVTAVAASEAACDGSLSMPARAARLLTPADVLTGEFRSNFWWCIRSADESALRRAADYIRAMRRRDSAPAIVSTGLSYGDVVRIAADARVSDFAVIDATEPS